ncbi:16455_t:CDS:2, partial [Cetraspora pellucida]
NSIYGITGYIHSPLYNKKVTLSVTALVHSFTRCVMEIIKEQGCNVVYENAEIKKQFWLEMINKTIRFSKELQLHINEILKKETSYFYIAVAYKKVLMPGIFPQKKMYFGIKHEDYTNFDNPKLFMKGRIIKKNATKFYRTIAIDIIYEVVKKYIDEKDLNLFKLTDRYNPNFKHTTLTDFTNRNFQSKKKSKNTKVINFMTRMNDNYKIEIVTRRFYYYIMTHQDKKAQTYENM